MGVGELCNTIGFCAWGWLSELARPRPQHPYSGEDIEEGTSEHGCSSSRPQSNLGYVLNMGCHVLLRADPVHVRGANGRSLLILHKTSSSMAEILLERIEASTP